MLLVCPYSTIRMQFYTHNYSNLLMKGIYPEQQKPNDISDPDNIMIDSLSTHPFSLSPSNEHTANTNTNSNSNNNNNNSNRNGPFFRLYLAQLLTSLYQQSTTLEQGEDDETETRGSVDTKSISLAHLLPEIHGFIDSITKYYLLQVLIQLIGLSG